MFRVNFFHTSGNKVYDTEFNIKDLHLELRETPRALDLGMKAAL